MRSVRSSIAMLAVIGFILIGLSAPAYAQVVEDNYYSYYDCYNAGWDDDIYDDDWYFDFYGYDASCNWDDEFAGGTSYYDYDYGYNWDVDLFDWEEDGLFM